MLMSLQKLHSTQISLFDVLKLDLESLENESRKLAANLGQIGLFDNE